MNSDANGILEPTGQMNYEIGQDFRKKDFIEIIMTMKNSQELRPKWYHSRYDVNWREKTA